MSAEDAELRDLASAAADGNLDAAERLFQGVHGYLFSFLYVLGIPDAEIADVAQQTAIELYKSLFRYSAEKPFLPWMRSIARHMAGKYWRARARREKRLDSFRKFVVARLEKHPQRDRLCDIASERLRRCIDELPEKHRHLVLLRYGEGHTAEQIAERQNRTGSAVRKSLSRVREDLRKCVETEPRKTDEPGQKTAAEEGGTTNIHE
ncbi:MAG: sigma-70 family RNA polymerase sigma factor [Kiritimatiellae bacterium]|nr:sigma-70 family RNA polymerase sigma factor [Kiritimatiellia bacterium]